MLNVNEKEKVKDILVNGGVIAYVTDTVWGLGCIPECKKAVEKIYQIKQRDKQKPLILMSDDVYPLFKYVESIPKKAQILMKKYFPGALTLVLKKSSETPDYITSDMDTVGIRVPDNEVFTDICSVLPNTVLPTTSANLSSQPPALTYVEAVNYIGSEVDYVVPDYGLSAGGCASTVIGFTDDDLCVFRQGDIFVDI